MGQLTVGATPHSQLIKMPIIYFDYGIDSIVCIEVSEIRTGGAYNYEPNGAYYLEGVHTELININSAENNIAPETMRFTFTNINWENRDDVIGDDKFDWQFSDIFEPFIYLKVRLGKRIKEPLGMDNLRYIVTSELENIKDLKDLLYIQKAIPLIQWNTPDEWVQEINEMVNEAVENFRYRKKIL